MLNHNRTRSLNESIITFAHEVAHSFDAHHDDNFDEREDCFGKGFIMDELFNSSNLVNHNKFSNCSLDSMVSKLTELEQSLGEDECFKVRFCYHLSISLVLNSYIKSGGDILPSAP